MFSKFFSPVLCNSTSCCLYFGLIAFNLSSASFVSLVDSLFVSLVFVFCGTQIVSLKSISFSFSSLFTSVAFSWVKFTAPFHCIGVKVLRLPFTTVFGSSDSSNVAFAYMLLYVLLLPS